MSELNKTISFNAFHILVAFIIIRMFFNGKMNYIIDIINYINNITHPGIWFDIIYVFIIYLISINIKFEIGLRASVKFDL